MLGSTGSSAGSYGTAGAGSSSGSSSGKTVVGFGAARVQPDFHGGSITI
eukprot:gene21095-1791_t